MTWGTITSDRTVNHELTKTMVADVHCHSCRTPWIDESVSVVRLTVLSPCEKVY